MNPRGLLVRHQADAEPAAQSLCRIDEVGIPALAPQRFGGRGVCEFVLFRRSQRLRRHRIGQRRQRVGIEHMFAVPLQHRHEHPVAPLGALHQHRRDDRHHHAEKALPADTFADLGEADRRPRPQRLVISPQQCVVVLATILASAARSRGSKPSRSSPGPRRRSASRPPSAPGPLRRCRTACCPVDSHRAPGPGFCPFSDSLAR